MIQPIVIRLSDRDGDLNFYTKTTPILVTLIDFNRNQNRTISNGIIIDQYINEDSIIIEEI